MIRAQQELGGGRSLSDGGEKILICVRGREIDAF